MPQKYFNMMTNVKIKRGFKTTLTISISNVIEPDSDMKHLLSIEQRECRYSEEVPSNMTLFNEYSQSGCIFECMAMYSKKVCQCIPWDMIRNNDSENVPICNGMGSHCFYENMNDNSFRDKSCYCLPDCHSIQYATVKDEIPLSADYCKGLFSEYSPHITARLPIVSLLYDQMYKYMESTRTEDWNHYELHRYSRDRYNFKAGVRFFDETMCQDWVIKDLAIIEIQMTSPAYLKMTQSAKVTLSDKISSIGGTLGLFTGFSLLAIVEILYWIIITIKNYFKFLPPMKNFQKSNRGFKEKMNP